MLTVGLTGGIAGGKSTVAGYLVELGAVAVDADLIAREVMSVGTEVYAALVAHFGDGMIASDGSIDRGRLASIVFDDAEQLAALNRIVHPATIERISAILDEWRADSSDRIGVVQVPLLIETRIDVLFDVVLLVVSTPEQQISRLMEMGLTVDQGLARMRSQLSDAERLTFADFTLLNKCDLGRLKEQTAVVYAKLKRGIRGRSSNSSNSGRL